METKTIIDHAKQYYQSMPNHSFMTFTISEKGDIFISGDWGYWAYAFRSSENFKVFLCRINSDYLINKLESNSFQFQYTKKKGLPSRVREALEAHFMQFQKTLKQEIEESEKVY